MTLLMMFATAGKAEAPPPPQNGPSGGLSWLRGRRAPFADEVLDLRPLPPRRKRGRDDLLFLKP